jgi:predicted transcriptional regulator
MKHIKLFEKFINESFNWKYTIDLRELMNEYDKDEDLSKLVDSIGNKILDHSEQIKKIFGEKILKDIEELVDELCSYGDSTEEEFDAHYDDLSEYCNEIRLLLLTDI